MASGIDPLLQARHRAANLCFQSAPLHIDHVAAECDLAVLSAGHGTIASMLLAGKPSLLLPKFVEQLMNAQTVVRLGAGLISKPIQPGDVRKGLDEMLANERFAKAAQGFAGLYPGFVPGEQLPELVGQLEGLISSRPSD